MELEDKIFLELFNYIKNTYNFNSEEGFLWVWGPSFTPDSSIKSGIKSSKFDSSSSKKFIINKKKTKPGITYFAEIQTSYHDKNKFLAVLESKSNENQPFTKWVTNDAGYAKTHENVFGFDILDYLK